MMLKISTKCRSRLQSGFTLIEFIVGLAITTVIMSIIAGSIYQVIFRQSDTKDIAAVMLSLQDAGQWINRDVMNSQFIDISNPQQLKLAYTVQWPTNTSFQYVYTYDVTYDYTGSELRRIELLNTKIYNSTTGALVKATDNSHQTLIARNVSGFQVELTNNTVRLSLTASVENHTEKREYVFSPRIS